MQQQQITSLIVRSRSAPQSYPNITSAAPGAGPGASFPASPLPPSSALPFQASDGERG